MGPFWTHFPNFGSKKNSPGKSGSATHNFTCGSSSTMPNFKKKLIEFQENVWAEGWIEGRTDPILKDHSGYRRGSNKVKINFLIVMQKKSQLTFNIPTGLILNFFLVEKN